MTAVVVPLKSFDLAKGRLSDALTPAQRAELAQTMATRVVTATHDLPAWVVCDDPDVAAWALSHAVGIIWREPTGLNNAARAGVEWCRQDGHARVIIAHGDLPLATDMTWLAKMTEDVVVVTDRRQDGSNVVVVPADADFKFQYGPGSAAKHQVEAERLGLSFALLEDPELSWDIDVPEDLEGLEL